LTLVVPDGLGVAPLQPLYLDWLHAADVEVAVLRLDLLDPLISGNKWFKLKHHLQAASAARADGVISLGGAHSNHLHALAAAGQRFAFTTVGLLRGTPQETPTVRDLRRFGMHLHWLGHGGYRARHQPGFWDAWRERYPGFYCLPEGGGGLAGALGCGELLEHVGKQLPRLGWSDYHAWWLACGTGTTLAGLVLAEAGAHPVHGAMAVPASHGVAAQVRSVLAEAAVADTGYHLLDASRGAFARVDDELLAFLHTSEAASGVPLEPVYTAKALIALRHCVGAGYFARGSRLVFIHTGGLQGRDAALSLRQPAGPAPLAGNSDLDQRSLDSHE